MSIGTRLFTWLKGEEVGTDEFGNRYFQERTPVNPRRPKRWVLYKGIAEPSKVPPEWHAWLHKTVNDVPKGPVKRYDWQKQHMPNLTGTDLAYRQPGHALAGGQRPKATGDYEPWQPN